MDMKRKLEVVQQAVRSISEHTDADSTVLLAALDMAQCIVTEAQQRVRERGEREAREALGFTSQG